MSWILSTRQMNFVLVAFIVALVITIAGCSSGEPGASEGSVQERSSDSPNEQFEAFGDDEEFGAALEALLTDLSCDIISEEEIISIAGIGNSDVPVVVSESAEPASFHCGWESGGSRNVRVRGSEFLPDALATLSVFPITYADEYDMHMFMREGYVENEPELAIPELGETAYIQAESTVTMISGDYIITVLVIVDDTDEDLAAAKDLISLVNSRIGIR